MGSKPRIAYEPDFAVLARQKMREGYTRAELAKYFGIAQSTLYQWVKDHPDFAEALKRGADFADAQVEDSLYRRALGYEYDEVEIVGEGERRRIKKIRRHVLPDVVACIFWLKNRQRQRWRDKVPEEPPNAEEQLQALIESNRLMAEAVLHGIERDTGERVSGGDAAMEPVHRGDAEREEPHATATDSGAGSRTDSGTLCDDRKNTGQR